MKSLNDFSLDNEHVIQNPTTQFYIFPNECRNYDGEMLHLNVHGRMYYIMFRHTLTPSGDIYYRIEICRMDRLQDKRIVEISQDQYIVVKFGAYRLSAIRPLIPLHRYELIPWALDITRGHGHRDKYITEKYLPNHPNAVRHDYSGFVTYTDGNSLIYSIDSTDNLHYTKIVKILNSILKRCAKIYPAPCIGKIQFTIDYCRRRIGT